MACDVGVHPLKNPFHEVMSEGLPRVGSALLVRDEANRILLGKRNKDPQRGSWVIPGGKIHAFESIAEAACRELKEETGLEVEVTGQFGVYEIINPPSEHRLVIYSWARVIGGVPQASDDLSEIRFFSLHELGEAPTTPLVRRVLCDAGLVSLDQDTRETKLEEKQLRLWVVPLLIAGASSGRRETQRSRSRNPIRRSRHIDNSPLLFDTSLST